jgi:hypothetical protein
VERVQGDLAETQETPERRAALHVLELTGIGRHIDVMAVYRHGVLAVRDRGGFETATQLRVDDLPRGEMDFVDDDGSVVFAWPCARHVAAHLATAHAERLLATFAQEQVGWEQAAIYGQTYRTRDPDLHYGDSMRNFMNASSALNFVGTDQIKLHAGTIFNLFDQAFVHRELSSHGRQRFHDALYGSIDTFTKIARKELNA